MTPAPQNIQLIGNEVAVRWPDGREDFFVMEKLRAVSPSAENIGEPDLLGNIHGADPRTEFPGVTVEGWKPVGNYGVRFEFSDGHNTGIFSYEYLRQLGEEMAG